MKGSCKPKCIKRKRHTTNEDAVIDPCDPEYISKQIHSVDFNDDSATAFDANYTDVWTAHHMMQKLLKNLHPMNCKPAARIFTDDMGNKAAEEFEAKLFDLRKTGSESLQDFVLNCMGGELTEAAEILKAFSSSCSKTLREFNTSNDCQCNTLQDAVTHMTSQQTFSKETYILTYEEWKSARSKIGPTGTSQLNKQYQRYCTKMEDDYTAVTETGMLAPIVDIVVIGATGSGKSETANLLLNSDNVQFEVSAGMDSATKEVQKGSVETTGRTLTVFDTPSFPITPAARDQVIFEMIKIIVACSLRMPVFLCVVKNNLMDKKAFSQLQLLQDILGKEVLSRTIICLTAINSTHEHLSMKQYLDELWNSADTTLQPVKDIIFTDLQRRVVRVDANFKCAKVKECARDIILSAISTVINPNQIHPPEIKYIEDLKSDLKDAVEEGIEGTNPPKIFEIGKHDSHKLQTLTSSISKHTQEAVHKKRMAEKHLNEINSIVFDGLLKVVWIEDSLRSKAIKSFAKDKIPPDYLTAIGEKQLDKIVSNNMPIMQYLNDIVGDYEELYTSLIPYLNSLDAELSKGKQFLERQGKYDSREEILQKVGSAFSDLKSKLSEGKRAGEKAFISQIIEGRKEKWVTLFDKYVDKNTDPDMCHE